MIYKVEMFAGKCDNCKEEVFENSDYSCLVDESSVEEEMSNSEWYTENGKHYCSWCFTCDDNDNIDIIIERIKP